VLRARFDAENETLLHQQVIFEGSPGPNPEMLGTARKERSTESSCRTARWATLGRAGSRITRACVLPKSRPAYVVACTNSTARIGVCGDRDQLKGLGQSPLTQDQSQCHGPSQPRLPLRRAPRPRHSTTRDGPRSSPGTPPSMGASSSR
jgi:hypothetical protein